MAEIQKLNDVKCAVCHRSKLYEPRCPGKHGKAGGGDDKDTDDKTSIDGGDATVLTSKQIVHGIDQFAPRENKWAQFAFTQLALKFKPITIEELIEMLVYEINKDGTLTFQIKPGLSESLKEAVRRFLKNVNSISSVFEEFKKYLKEKKGILISNHQATLSSDGDKFTVKKIPDRELRHESPRPEPTAAREFMTPFRMTPFSIRPR